MRQESAGSIQGMRPVPDRKSQQLQSLLRQESGEDTREKRGVSTKKARRQIAQRTTISGMNSIAFAKVQEIVKRHAENERKMKEELKRILPCPLCGEAARDMMAGVGCPRCGLWLADSAETQKLGGYRKVWNIRA